MNLTSPGRLPHGRPARSMRGRPSAWLGCRVSRLSSARLWRRRRRFCCFPRGRYLCRDGTGCGGLLCAGSLQLCLLLGQRLCTCGRLPVLRGQRRPLPGSSSSPALCRLCRAPPGLPRGGRRSVPGRACAARGRRCSPLRTVALAGGCSGIA